MIVIYFLAGSGACSIISMFFPSTHKNTALQGLLDLANAWAFNVNKAENKDDARP
jgi:hypothetical protein